jgi:hypothetical protein
MSQHQESPTITTLEDNKHVQTKAMQFISEDSPQDAKRNVQKMFSKKQ